MKKIFYFVFAASTVFNLASCIKFNEETQSDSEDVLKMEMDENDFLREEETISNPCNLDYASLLAPCAVVTESSSTFPKTVTIDYGTGCVDANGRTKKGKIIINVSGDMRVAGSKRTLTFDNFYINEIKIEGSRNAENTGPNTAGNMVVKVTGDITASNSEFTRSRSFTRYREWVSGISTCEISDDEIHVTGSGKAIGRRGIEIPHTITEKIVLKPGQCKYPLSGKVDIGGKRRGVILNFDNGSCDNVAEATTKRRNNTYQIDLDTRRIIK
jgi:hypothetical protein